MKILTFLLLFSTAIFAQTDLEARRQGIERLTSSDPEAAFKEISAIAVEHKNADEKTKAKIESTMALVMIYMADLEGAEKKNDWSFSVHSKSGEAQELARNYFSKALIAERRSDYVHSIDFFLKTITYAEKSKQFTLLQKSNRGLAMSYCDQRDYNKALDFINKSLSYQKQKPDPMQQAYSLAAKGEIYRLKGDLKTANQYLKEAHDTFEKAGNEHGRAWVLTNWAICHENNLLKYARMALEAQEIWDKVAPENTMSIVNLGNIGYNFMVMARDSAMVTKGQPDLPQGKAALVGASERYYKRALALARKKKNWNAVIYQTHNLAALHYMNADYKSAYDNLNITLRLNDSIFSQQNKNKIAALESEKKILLRDEKIRLDQIRLENHQKQRWYLFGGLALLACIGVLLFRQNQNRKNHNQRLLSLNNELDQANKVKTRFFSILNHDLRRPVYNLIHYLQLQKESPELLDADSKERIEGQTLQSAENLLASMEDLLLWSKGQMEHFEPSAKAVAVGSVFLDLQHHFESESAVSLHFENPENITITTDGDYLKTILRNLIGNAIKAMEGQPNATIWVKSFSNHKRPVITVCDNGKGIQAEQYKALYDENEVVGIGTGLGFHLIRDLAKAIGTTVSVESNSGEGTTFTLTFN